MCVCVCVCVCVPLPLIRHSLTGKLLFKVEHVDPERYSVGVAECEKVARALGYRLDTSAFMQDKSYKLVVSTPGIRSIKALLRLC